MAVPAHDAVAGFISLWRRAREVEFGIAIPTNNLRWLERKLYAARKASGDPELNEVMMMRPKMDEIWLCRKEVELEP